MCPSKSANIISCYALATKLVSPLTFIFRILSSDSKPLSRYALNEKNIFIYTMEITIESTFVPGWNYTVRYDPSSWMKIHYIEIPDARGQVKARAKGTGYAVMMVSIYNCMYSFRFSIMSHSKQLFVCICPGSIGVTFGSSGNSGFS